jgi:hypothetical protein
MPREPVKRKRVAAPCEGDTADWMAKQRAAKRARDQLLEEAERANLNAGTGPPAGALNGGA